MSIGGWNCEMLVADDKGNKKGKSPIDEIIAMLTLTEEERYNWQEFVLAYRSGMLMLK